MSILESVPLLLSSAAIAISYYAATRAYKLSLRPYLIFYNAQFDPKEDTSWVIENAGNGPALNVVVGGDGGHRITQEADACVLPSIPKGHSMRVGWLSKRNILVATYRDVSGKQYTTTCVDNKITINNTNIYPWLRGVPTFFALKDRERALSESKPALDQVSPRAIDPSA